VTHAPIEEAIDHGGGVLRVTLAALHLTALGIGLGAVWARARGFGGTLDATGLRRLFAADSWWGLAAVLWIGTGLWRLLAGIEKPTAYYLHNHVFWLKMTALIGILLLEIVPMVTLIMWRVLAARGAPVDGQRASLFAAISYLQVVLVLLMVAAATAMARGVG
jgi:putative membrane protein